MILWFFSFVLVLTGIELILLTVASMGLCFGFVLKTVLIIQGSFRYCRAVLTWSQSLFWSSDCPTSETAGLHKKLWGDTGGTADHNWPKGYPTVWLHAQHIKLGEEQGSGRHLDLGCLSSQVTVMCDGTLLSWRWLNTFLPMGCNELIPWFTLLACIAFTLLIELALSRHTSFLTFTLLLPSPTPLEGEWARGCAVFSCHLRLNHDKFQVATAGRLFPANTTFPLPRKQKVKIYCRKNI